MGNHVIRDRIWESKKLSRCSKEAALAYPWIFLVADDWGRFEFIPRRIWSKVFGARNDVSLEEVTTWLGEYVDVGLLKRYSDDGELGAWTKFEGRPPSQRRPSQYPDPEELTSRKKAKRKGRASLGNAYGKDRSEQKQSGSRGGAETGAEEGAEGTPLLSAQPPGVPTEPPDVALRFVACFNAALERRVAVTPEIVEKVTGLMTAGYKPWQIVALPVLVEANGLDPKFRRELGAAILLRDGKHPRTSGTGKTSGATHWLERELQRADQTVLNRRQGSIASQFGVVEQLVQMGVQIKREEG